MFEAVSCGNLNALDWLHAEFREDRGIIKSDRVIESSAMKNAAANVKANGAV